MTSLIKCKVHSVVLFSILDAYERRNEENQKIFGTLLGMVDKDLVEITNCFPIIHYEKNDETLIQTDIAHNMYETNKKANANEVIVGWFSTSPTINNKSFEIHEHYSKLCANPIYLTLDTTLKNNKMDCKAYVNLNMGVPGKSFGSLFMPVDLTVVNYPTEQIAIDTLTDDEKRLLKSIYASNLNQASPGLNLSGSGTGQATKSGPPQTLPATTIFPLNNSDLKKVGSGLSEMIEKLKRVKAYVEAAKNASANASTGGTVPPKQEDVKIGRALQEIVARVPRLNPQDFEDMYKNNIKDMLMILYAQKLLMSQINIQSRLNTI